MPLINGGEFECERIRDGKPCGGICAIVGDGYKLFAWCYECDDYAEGFDGPAHFVEQAIDMADGRRKRAREEAN